MTAGGAQLVLELRPAASRHYASWTERLGTVARFSRPDEVHTLCEEAYALGARAVLAVVDAPIRQALLEFQRWRDVPIWAVVPNMFAFRAPTLSDGRSPAPPGCGPTPARGSW